MKKSINKLVVALFALFSLVSIMGLSSVKAQDEGYVIGLSMNTQTNPFFVSVVEGVQDAADELGIELIVTDAQDSSETQLKDVENIISQNPDALIIDPTDSDAIVPAIEAANEAGIPVFTMDRRANAGDVIAHIGYDAIRSGGLAADFLVEELDGEGKIVELQGIMGANVAQERSQGFNDVIAEHEGIEIVAQQVANFDRAEAMTVMENILTANPEIDGLYAANDEMLLGAMEAIEAAGRTDEIVVVGCDGLDETLEGIQEGSINATIAEPPFFLGQSILQVAYEYLEGNTDIEEEVILDNELITQENVAEFMDGE